MSEDGEAKTDDFEGTRKDQNDMRNAPDTTSKDVRIRRLASTDRNEAKPIAKLGALAWGRCPQVADVHGRAARLEQEIAALNPNAKALFVAEESEKLIGFCRIIRDGSNASHWWLAGIEVHPENRRCGIGRSLVQAGIDHARTRGVTVLRSETHITNQTSIRFHECVGFENDGPFTASDGNKKIAFSLEVR